MFLSWKGRGWLVGVSTAGCLLAADYFTGVFYHNFSY